MIFLSLILVFVIWPDSSAARAESVASSGKEAFAAQLLSTLEVTSDGLLAFRDSAKAKELLGSDWPAAEEEMRDLNARITSGDAPQFSNVDSLQNYRLKEPGGCQMAPGVQDGGALIDVAGPEATPNGNCYCGGCCTSGMCCKSGWWVFCWKYGTC